MQDDKELFEIVATTSYGLEDVLANEIEAIGAVDIEPLNRAVSFFGTKETLYRANLELRTALRVLVPVHSFTAHNEVELYDETQKFDWETYLSPDTTFAINSAVHSEFFNHANYVALKVKDSIVDRLRDVYGRRPNVELEDPDLRLHVHVSDRHCTISLDSSGNSLHKRGYRVGQGLAPINETLAAGMLLLAGWDGSSDFVDPMCGSGTIIMEAATIAYNIAPGILNNNFGFMKWKDFDSDLWIKVKSDAKSRERDFKHKIYGFDESPKAIHIAKDNIKNAGLGWKVIIKAKPMQELQPQDILNDGTSISNGLVMINPPYGERLEDMDSVVKLYKEIGDCLKQNFNGFNAWIISSNKQALKSVGLRTSKKIQLFNGSLECRFNKYELYQGSRKSKYMEREAGE